MNYRHWMILTIFIGVLNLNISSGEAPIFSCEGCMGEGMEFLVSRGLAFKIYKEPDESSQIVELQSLPKGTEIELSPENFLAVTRKAGLVRILQPVTFEGHSLGNVSLVKWDAAYHSKLKKFSLEKRTTFQQLLYAGEGGCYIKLLKETVLRQDCTWLIPGDNSTDYALESSADAEWWIRIKKGWARVDGASGPFEIGSKKEW